MRHTCCYNGWNRVWKNKTCSIHVSAAMSWCKKCTEHVCDEGIWNTHKKNFRKKKIFNTFACLRHSFKISDFFHCRSMEELQRKILFEKSKKLNLQQEKISKEKRQTMFILYFFLMKQTQPKQSGLSGRSCVIKQFVEDLWTFANHWK